MSYYGNYFFFNIIFCVILLTLRIFLQTGQVVPGNRNISRNKWSSTQLTATTIGRRTNFNINNPMQRSLHRNPPYQWIRHQWLLKKSIRLQTNLCQYHLGCYWMRYIENRPFKTIINLIGFYNIIIIII